MSAYQFTIYSRSYCHLCDALRDALRAALGECPHTIDMIDVDADPELLAQYDELVPVLIAGKDGKPAAYICHYFLDAEKLAAFLAD